MSLYLFNNQQKLIKSIPFKRLITLVQEQEINATDTLEIEILNKDWNSLKEQPFYVAVRDIYNKYSFHMYKITKIDTKDNTTEITAIQIGYDELKAYGYIKDRRFQDSSFSFVAGAIVDGTDWQLGYVDDNFPNINTNFYYISHLEALSKLIELTGCEVQFRVEITGNRIVAKRLDIYKKIGTDKGKRFAYGSKLLEITREEDTAELYTALVGRGKGEEVSSGEENESGEAGYGRKISFEDIEWSKGKGDPVDKPKGQEWVELPEMTALYGYSDGTPRTGIVEFPDTEEPEILLQQTYEQLIEDSRPKVQFKASVQNTGDMALGETVSIIRSDLGFRYKTRVYKVKRNYLNNLQTEVELGDQIGQSIAKTIRQIDSSMNRRDEELIQVIQVAANGKNRIFRQKETPTAGMMVNDLWYKPVGEGETELYRWNGEIWQLEKVSAGLLGGTLDAENGDVNLINVNVNNLVGNISEFVKSYWNAINSRAEINGDHLRFTHDNGSYTELSSKGLMRYDSGTGKQYHYMTKIIKFVIGGDNQSPTTKWIGIGSEFNNKQWSAALSISDSMTASSSQAAIHRIVLTQSVDGSGNTIQPRYRNGQWEIPVMGYKTNVNAVEDTRRYGPIAGIMIVTA